MEVIFFYFIRQDLKLRLNYPIKLTTPSPIKSENWASGRRQDGLMSKERIIMVYRSFFFGPGSDELFLAASTDGGEVNTVISSLVFPNLGQVTEDLFIINRQFESLVNGTVIHDSRNEVISGNVSYGILLFCDVGDLHGGGGGCSILILLVGEDVYADDGGFG